MIVSFVFLMMIVSTKAQDDCRPTRCHKSGPIIRFPFRLKGHQPEHCGYPGFDLSCNSPNSLEFDFQFPIRALTRNIVLPILAKAKVQSIDYQSQVIRVVVVNGSCFPTRVPEFNATTSSPFKLYNVYDDIYTGFTLFNCSTKRDNQHSLGPIHVCDDTEDFKIYAYESYMQATDLSVLNCTKMYNTSYIPGEIFNSLSKYSLYADIKSLYWPKPFCRGCEERRMHCGLKNNNNNETQCLDIPHEQNKKAEQNKKVIAVVLVGVFLIALAFAALYRNYIVKKRKQDNKKRILQFLEDYKDFRPSRYTYVEIKKITDNFKHKLGQGGYGTVFRGKLSNNILVAVKLLNHIKGNGEDFINEVATIGKIHHVNVVRLIGYCADGYKRALVYEFLQNDSLEKYISSGKQGTTLGWEKVHKIALGIAKGLDYLHQGCKQRILHFDIKPHNILLDQNLNPKVADFGLAKLCSKEKSVVTMTAARGTIGYISPEVFSRNFGKVSYKSDIYSFGMLLLNLVGGRKNFQAIAQDDSQIYFPEWMYNQLNKGEDIEIQSENENENETVRRLTIVGLWCIQWYPVDRPSTKVVIQMLEGENMPIMPPNPFAASEFVNTNASTFSGSVFSSESYITAKSHF
ncbi:hypothetical protein RD792_011560 [Penstemon davidsonii]|uniref:Protein kinase domain-containing protein n=1 Tax=Penstemon davidsonii TaxID=160366 RepID=A0ABR0CZW1_9LAMI|nr:hypothetical protein RD792_011560 [Penstemon davidsonii]